MKNSKRWLLTFRRKSLLSQVTTIGAGVTLLLALASTSIVSAATAKGAICTTNGSHLCLYVPNFNYGTRVVSSPSGTNRTMCAPSAGSTGVIQFCGVNAPANRCVDAYNADTYDLEVSACSGVTGIDWTNIDNGNGTRYLENVHYSNRYMAGDNISGDPWVGIVMGEPGWYYEMRPIE